ncbi:hydroxymethylglutaryl-coenzyme A reductase-domain-containing protein [Thamnidium elegans]|nr:hydroxymethylglutaryl-coenzyme A reductase-domain-containing protein [Thamnidium elegans]
MHRILSFSYKSAISLLNTLVIKTTRQSAKNPIEMMVSSLILGSVTYVYLFNLAKSSELLASATYPSSARATVLYASARDTSFSPTLEYTTLIPPITHLGLKQLAISQVNGLSKQGLINILQFQDYVESDLHFSDGRLSNAWTYRDNLCYKTKNKCFMQSPLDNWNYDINQLQKDQNPLSKLDFYQQNKIVLSFLFDLNDGQHVQAAALWEQKVMSLSLDKLVPLTKHHNYERTSTILWLARVIKNISKDMTERMNNASKIDLIVISTGYVLMASTFLSLYIRMHKLGSKYTLATTIFMSGFFSFMLSLATVYKLGSPVNPILLSEATPFLIVTIGFERPYKLTKCIFEENSKYTTDRTTNNVHHVISNAVRLIAPSLIRDGFLEILVFMFGAKSTLPGLREFCLMSAILIAYDMVLMFTWYISVLSLKLELRKIQETTIIRVTNSPSTSTPLTTVRESVRNSSKKPTIIKTKLLLIIGFLIMHVFEFCSTLSFSSSETNLHPKSAMTTSSTMEPILTSILHHHRQSVNGTASLLLRASLPLYFQILKAQPSYVVLWPPSITGLLAKLYTTYTIYAQDPVISKWVIAILMASVLLNTYLFEIAKHAKPHQIIQTILTDQTVPKKQHRKKGKGKGKGTIIRTLDNCLEILHSSEMGAPALADEEVISLVQHGHIAPYSLDKVIGDFERAARIRKKIISKDSVTQTLEASALPVSGYDYAKVLGACCENVIGYMPIPIGVAGPMLIDGSKTHIPMATTEGCLIASVSRDCKAANGGGGATTVITADSMTRGPCVEFPNITQAGQCKQWMETQGLDKVTQAFNSTSRFSRIKNLQIAVAGKLLYIRFSTATGDAMGMNMISKGCEKALATIAEQFPGMQIVSLSGNCCTDKKPAAINWIEGRGKSVVTEAVISREIVEKVLKTSIEALVELNLSKDLIGYAIAGSVGGFNAHAANILAAVYIAADQDPAQNVESSNCITLMKCINNGRDLHISCSIPSIEVGTMGGGTILPPQQAMLDILGVCGPHITHPGKNAQRLARIICATVMAGELSLCSALAAGHSIQAHMEHNRTSFFPLC